MRPTFIEKAYTYLGDQISIKVGHSLSSLRRITDIAGMGVNVFKSAGTLDQSELQKSGAA